MQKNVVLFMSAAALLALSSCSSKLGALSADNFSVNPNPLETEAGKVPTTINGKFPEKYMKKKAVVTVLQSCAMPTARQLRATELLSRERKWQATTRLSSIRLVETTQ